jgi:DNA polymerase III epsilon subunit family exonuclease
MSKQTTSLADTEFVAFDLETTGLDAVAAHIVEIGAVRFCGDGTVLEEFEQLVRPPCDIPTRVTRIHGITNTMVRDQPAIGDVLPAFAAFLGDEPAVLLAHNAGFDVSFLSMAITRTGQPLPAHPVLDTCGLARQRLSLPDYRLETIGRYLRLVGAGAHRAKADAELVMGAFAHMVRKRPAIRNTTQLFAMTAEFNLESSPVEETG